MQKEGASCNLRCYNNNKKEEKSSRVRPYGRVLGVELLPDQQDSFLNWTATFVGWLLVGLPKGRRLCARSIQSPRSLPSIGPSGGGETTTTISL